MFQNAMQPDTGLSDRIDEQSQRLTTLEANQQAIFGQLQMMTNLLQTVVAQVPKS